MALHFDPARATGRKRLYRPMSEINVTPFVDVMLVLLVIFMVTAPLIQTGSIDLPSVGKAAQPPVAPLEVIVHADRTIALRDRAKGSAETPVTREELAARIKAAQERNPALDTVDGGHAHAVSRLPHHPHHLHHVHHGHLAHHVHHAAATAHHALHPGRTTHPGLALGRRGLLGGRRSLLIRMMLVMIRWRLCLGQRARRRKQHRHRQCQTLHGCLL